MNCEPDSVHWYLMHLVSKKNGIPPFIYKPQFQATAARNEKHAKNALLKRRPHPPTFPLKANSLLPFFKRHVQRDKVNVI